MQKHGAMHEPITSHNSNGVSITREQLLYSTPAVAGRVTEVISGIKTNYHSCKGLREARTSVQNARHGAWRGKRENSSASPLMRPADHWYSISAGRPRRALSSLYRNVQIPHSAHFSHSRRTTARLTQFTVAGVINAASSIPKRRGDFSHRLYIRRLQRCCTAVERSSAWRRRQARNPTFNSTEFYQSRDSI